MIYCKNSDFLKMLKKYEQTKDRRTKNEIGKTFVQIAERFLRKASFVDYTEDRKKEMVSDATYYMWRFIGNFDLTQKNPFSFFTTIVKHAVYQYLNDRKKYDAMFTCVDYVDFFKKHDDNRIEN